MQFIKLVHFTYIKKWKIFGFLGKVKTLERVKSLLTTLHLQRPAACS